MSGKVIWIFLDGQVARKLQFLRGVGFLEMPQKFMWRLVDKPITCSLRTEVEGELGCINDIYFISIPYDNRKKDHHSTTYQIGFLPFNNNTFQWD